jgi:cytochrome c biogenesis protein CcmG/thiol:disulfide interchange protein DsbE
VLINFYASWCPPCAEEAPVLAALKVHGVTIVGVAWKDDPDKTRAFLARYGDPYAARFVDRDGRAGIDFGITAAPETYVVGADGRILDKIAAPLSVADAQTLAAEVGR